VLRLYLDEDSMSTALTSGLRRLTFDVLTTEEALTRRQPDGEQLTYATEQARAIFTQNVGDYSGLHRMVMQAGGSHAGIILLTDKYGPVGLQLRCSGQLARTRSQESLRDSPVCLFNYA
jgi:hypothetical protein